jgi:hypothetical protein
MVPTEKPKKLHTGNHVGFQYQWEHSRRSQNACAKLAKHRKHTTTETRADPNEEAMMPMATINNISHKCDVRE